MIRRSALVLAFAAAIAGCSPSIPLSMPKGADTRTGTYPGNHEAIAWCVGDMASRSNAGPPAQRVDKAARTTTLTRDGQYEIVFRQVGGSRVQADGRRLPGGGDGLNFVWPQIDQCALQLITP